MSAADITWVVNAVYSLLSAILVWLVSYPYARDLCDGLFSSKESTAVMAVVLTLAMSGGGVVLVYSWADSMIGLMMVFASLYSGFSLLYSQKQFYVGALLFAFSVALSRISFVLDPVMGLMAQLISKTIVLAGVVQGTFAFILPVLIEERVRSNDGYRGAVGAIVVALCAISIYSETLNWSTPLASFITYSDLTFLVGGVFAFLLKHLVRKGMVRRHF